jgi:hypothetical protein
VVLVNPFSGYLFWQGWDLIRELRQGIQPCADFLLTTELRILCRNLVHCEILLVFQVLLPKNIVEKRIE